MCLIAKPKIVIFHFFKFRPTTGVVAHLVLILTISCYQTGKGMASAQQQPQCLPFYAPRSSETPFLNSISLESHDQKSIHNLKMCRISILTGLWRCFGLIRNARNRFIQFFGWLCTEYKYDHHTAAEYLVETKITKIWKLHHFYWPLALMGR